MHSKTPVGLLRPDILKYNRDAGGITRMSKKRVQTGKFSNYVALLIEGNSYSCLQHMFCSVVLVQRITTAV